jgi:phosphatidate cytidylyltransferase
LAEKMSTRIAVGLTLLAALLSLLGWDHMSGHAWGVGIMVTVLTGWGGREIAKLLAHAGAPPATAVLMLACVALSGTRVLGEELGIPALRDSEGALLAAFAFLVLFPPLIGTPSREAFLGIAATVFGVFYVWFLGSYVLRLRYLPRIGESACFYAILVSKGSDICAYFTGKAFGRTKLIPSISPGKTVAGFTGGLVGAVLITAAFSAWTPLGTALPMKFSAPVGIILGLISIAGDLVESLFKRSAELKDSARLLPTFGGILDVIDSVLTAAPATYYILILMKPLTGVA